MGSSSKAKSSKKRSSKIHSQPRKLKKVKKSRRSKSKKVTSRHDTSSDDSMSSQSISSASNDSHSLYSDSDSMSSVSLSSSSSEHTYRGRKKVLPVRSKLRSTRKRVRRRSPSSQSSEDFSRKKKRKRSRKNADSKSRNKFRKSKPRSSSATSDSYGCSTCKEKSGSFSEDSSRQRLRNKSREKKKHKRESREERVETKERAHRSPSCSSHSRSRDQSYSVSRGEENFIGEDKSRRLRSVITFAEQAQNEENKSEKDLLKEEIIYDHDDYPFPRSNDSSGGGSKRDVTSRSPVTSGDKRQKENVEGEETCVSNHGVTVATESRKNADDQNIHDSLLNEFETNKLEKENRTHGSLLGANLGADDLEAILREKALENLRKFRGGSQRNVKASDNQKNKDDEDATQSFSYNAEIVRRVLAKEVNANVIDHVQMLDRNTRTMSVEEVSCRDKDIADQGNSGVESGVAKHEATCPPDGSALSGNPIKEDDVTMQAVGVESDSQSSFYREKTSSVNSSLNQTMVLQTSSDNKLTESMESETKIPPRTTHSITPSNSITNDSEAGVNTALSSGTLELASREQSALRGQGSNEQQTEAKDGSQFEQKTMSVMRGGEMVQVSYKVYIPKKAPALARRQLKR